MEFLNKRDRLVLTTISQSGPAGIDASTLISLLSPLMTKESIMRSIEELIIKDLVKVTNLGQGEVRYVSSKNVRDAMINLDIQRLKIAEYVKELNTKKDEILKLQDKNQQIEQLRNIVLEGLSIISIGLINLYNSMPELTIPEYVESIQPLIEVMEKLYKLVQKSYTKEETDAILKIIEKYRGEKDYRILKEMLEKEEMSQKDKSI